jgi:hypothetical protein
VTPLPLSRQERALGPSASRSSVPACLYCGEWDITPNVECWEEYDVLVCEDCAGLAHDNNGRFGVGA